MLMRIVNRKYNALEDPTAVNSKKFKVHRATLQSLTLEGSGHDGHHGPASSGILVTDEQQMTNSSVRNDDDFDGSSSYNHNHQGQLLDGGCQTTTAG